MCSRLYFYFPCISPDITILFLFSGEWCLKAKIWMLGVLIDTSRLLFPNPLSERVMEHTYVFTYTRKCSHFWINLSIENILSSHRYLHFQPNISGFILVFSFSLFLTTFSVRTLVSIFLSRFTYFSKTPIYNKVPIALSCVHIFSHSMWKHCTPAAFLCGLPLQPVWTLTLLATVAPAVPYHLPPEWALAVHWNWIIQEWTGKEEEKWSLLFKTALLRLI